MRSNSALKAQLVCLSLVKQINHHPASLCRLQTNNTQSVSEPLQSELQREK